MAESSNYPTLHVARICCMCTLRNKKAAGSSFPSCFWPCRLSCLSLSVFISYRVTEMSLRDLQEEEEREDSSLLQKITSRCLIERSISAYKGLLVGNLFILINRYKIEKDEKKRAHRYTGCHKGTRNTSFLPKFQLNHTKMFTKRAFKFLPILLIITINYSNRVCLWPRHLESAKVKKNKKNSFTSTCPAKKKSRTFVAPDVDMAAAVANRGVLKYACVSYRRAH